MVKPARTAPLPARPAAGSPSTTRGVVRAAKARRQRRARTGWKPPLDPSAATQPAPGTAQAGKLSPSPGPDQGGAKAMDESKGLDDFMTTGRTGRRNALPDICDDQIKALTTASLPIDMAKLSCTDESSTDPKPAKKS